MGKGHQWERGNMLVAISSKKMMIFPQQLPVPNSSPVKGWGCQ